MEHSLLHVEARILPVFVAIRNHPAKTQYGKSKQIFPEKELRGVCCRKIWEYINLSQTHECENWD
jgi:hypothetical protein